MSEVALPRTRAELGGGNGLIAALLSLGMLLLLASIASASWTLTQYGEHNRWVQHTLAAEASINRMEAANEQLETGRRGFLLSGANNFQGVTEQAAHDFEVQHGSLTRLVRDNPVQLRRLAEIEKLHIGRRRALALLFTDPANRKQIAEGDFSHDRAVAIVRAIRALSAQMAASEAELLIRRTQNQYDALLRLYVVGGLAILLLIAILGSVIWLIWRYNRSLGAAQAELRRANEGLEEAVSARTAELQRANQEIQRFAYIVSHDLRSPLVNVLGFTAELDQARKIVRGHLADLYARHPALRDGAAWTAVDEDVPEALTFIRASTEKMDRLINSILELSRQGRRQLHPEALDLDKLVTGVIQTLHQRALDAGATVTAAPLPTLQSDRIAVEQILSNLVENAIKYLQPGRVGEIHIEGRRFGKQIQIDVIDNGRGISPPDHERVFELFRRSGKQDQPGEGIGLANVRALAYRLGGTIELESTLDQGSRFRLSLPAKFVATDTVP